MDLEPVARGLVELRPRRVHVEDATASHAQQVLMELTDVGVVAPPVTGMVDLEHLAHRHELVEF
jgi:hypothetical protein